MAYGPWGNEVVASSRFKNTWITDPDNPAETIVKLRYGGVGRQNSRDRAKTAMQFVGRSYPVYDVGDARAESISVDATLSSEDGDAEDQLELLEQMIGDGEVILYRDGRGRKIFAVGTDFQAEDLEQGSCKVTFLLNRVDYDEALPEPEDVVVIPAVTTPQNVTVSVDNYSGMALVDWDAVENVQLYHLYLNGIEVGSTSEDVTTYGPLVTGEYSIEVTATVGGAESARSTPVSFNVARPTTPPDDGGGGGGTTTPPTTVPQNFRAFPTASNSVTLQWDSVAGATDYQVFEIRSPNGVTNGITTSTTMVRGASTPLADGPFDYWVKARVNGVWSAESNHQQFSFPYSGGPITGGTGGGGSGGGDGGAMPPPTVILGIKNGDAGYLHYNLGCGFTDSKGMKDYDPQTLEDWSTTTAAELANNYWSIIDAAGKYAVATTVAPDATTTSGSSYPRCEHREMQQTSSGNNDKANWTIDSGDHDFNGFSRIMTLPPAKPGVCINQLHDQSDDTVMIKTMSLSGKVAVVLDVFGTRVKVIQADYKLGIEIWSRIRINNATLTVYYAESASATTSAAVTGTVNYTHPSAIPNSNPPWYHKFGCYAQSNDTTDTSGTKCLVQIRDWKQWHTGWPTPVTGNYAGPGGSGGTGAPVVAAGADATVAPGATFSRTGQVVGSGITAQGWRLVGSAGSTTDPSTAAGQLGWGVPSAESDEFNYTGNPDATKWNVYNGTGHGGNGVRSPLRVSVANGRMTLTGLAGSANTAGLEHKLDRQYGKWEFRARSYYTSDPAAPGDKTGGYHPVGIIWSDHASWPLDGEYDFLENGEPGQQAAGAFLHYPSLNGTDSQIDVPDYPVDMRQFHNFAIDWTSTFIKLYVDGVLWYTASGGAVASVKKNIQAMTGGHLTLQLDAFQATGLIGSAMEIEWVRTYPVTPVLSNPQLSTSAQLNWIAPTTVGNYTLEFFATNSSGTSTDQVVVAVATGTPTGGGEGSTVPVGQTTTFTEDFENGNFARWTSVQNKSYEGSASSYNLATTYSQKIVNQNADHPHALRTEVRDGDTAVGSNERAELSSFGKSWNDNSGDERWYEFYVRFGDPTWNVSWSGENDWLIFFQWHQPVDDGAPAVAMSVHNDNKVYFEREPDSDFEFIGPLWTVRPGVWEKVVVHIKWSPNSSTGFLHAYVNDVEVLPKKMCKTQYSADFDDYYVKLGTYRRSTVSGTSVVMHDNIRISGPPAG